MASPEAVCNVRNNDGGLAVSSAAAMWPLNVGGIEAIGSPSHEALTLAG